MLVEINIKNFAIIDDIKILFDNGFNVLTGETGSGKSIIIEGLGMILGERASKELIRSGTDKATIEGLFILKDNSKVFNYLLEYGIDFDSNNYLVITRELFSNGRSISRINGRIVPLNFLNRITKNLVDIHGQHEHQSLLDRDNQRKLLDSFGGDEVKELLQIIKKKLEELNMEKQKLQELSINEMEKNKEIDLLKFQLEEINTIDLENFNEKEVDEEFNKLLNSKEIINSISNISSLLNYSDENRISIIDELNKINIKFNNINKFDKDLKGYSDKISEIYYELIDINREINLYIDNFHINDERFSILEEQILIISNLKKKYGNTIEDILIYKNKISKRLKVLMDLEREIETVKNKIKVLEDELFSVCKKLTSVRFQISRLLEKNIYKELNDLNMENVSFKIEISQLDYFTNEGLDRIEFLIATNKGEDLKLLSKIISGGEMSRIMLAFKSILANYDDIPTLIFDEIDTGISGRTAQVVGEKIYDISKNHQIICISHLPQITAIANSHFLINKEFVGDKSYTSVVKLNKKERIKELARLLGGSNVTETTLLHATEMLDTYDKKHLS